MKKVFRILLAASVITGLTVMTTSMVFAEKELVGSGIEATGDLAANAPDAPTTTGEGIKIAFVCPGTLGDKALGDTTWLGINNLKEDYPGIEIKIYESPNGSVEWEPNLVAASEWADLVIANAANLGDILIEVSKSYPDVKYVANERSVTDNPQIASDAYKCNEIAFLLGCIAGMMTQDTSIPGINEDHIVAFVGGTENPTCLDYVEGFRAGAEYTCPDVITLVSFTNSWQDPVLAKETTKGLISQGADVILPALANAVVGAFEACTEGGCYSFGLDTNKDGDYLGTIITSGLKCGEVTSYKFGKEFIEGTFEGGFFLMGVDSGALDITDMSTFKEYMNLEQIDEIYDKVCEIREDVKAGKIDIPYIPATRGEE